MVKHSVAHSSLLEGAVKKIKIQGGVFKTGVFIQFVVLGESHEHLHMVYWCSNGPKHGILFLSSVLSIHPFLNGAKSCYVMKIWVGRGTRTDSRVQR